ncbi:hypothetical protein B0O80DRAFT_527483 [Mortierella sp. GBAus27b]|nr:hypothetical protein BGX31_006460 [Mortierella sp. GBA43]KAI8357725.1 hypothetical protein B0O80DRAFT_527483 [Mortierella sp. GBAus27b]
MDIAEILQLVASYLDPKTLVAATQVSRHWHHCCTPVLWSSISQRDWSLPRFNSQQLHRKAHLVHSLEWHSTQYIPSASTGSPTHNYFMAAMGILSTPPQAPPATTASPMVWPHLAAPSQAPETGAETAPATASTTSTSPLKHKKALATGVFYELRQGLREQDPPIQLKMSLTWLNKILGRCTNVQKLSLHGKQQGVHDDIIKAILSLRYLESLELYTERVMTIDRETKMTTTRLLNIQKDLLRHVPQLETLVLRGNAFSFQSLPEASILNDVPTTTKETGDGNNNNDSSSSNSSNSSSIHPQPSQIDSTIVQGSCIVPLAHPALVHDGDGDGASSSSSTLVASLDNPLPTLPITTTAAAAFITTFPLKHLSLDTTLSEAELTMLLRQCPVLESLDLPGGLAWVWSDDFITGLAQSCPRLGAFSINSSCHPPVPEERLTALVKALPPLRRFGARSSLLGDSTLDALEERSPDLKMLDISLSKNRHLSKPRLYKYLRHANQLTRLEADGVWICLDDLEDSEQQQQQQQQGQQGQGQQQEQVVVPDFLAASPPLSSSSYPPPPNPNHTCREWASRHTLKKLTIGFSCPDRGTTKCHGMYNLLSTLTELEVLHISNSRLDLSAKSGFNQLKSLTKLRTFSIETSAYNPLTQQDVVRMATTWPQLERICVNNPGASKERQFREWLRKAQREDIVISSPLVTPY